MQFRGRSSGASSLKPSSSLFPGSSAVPATGYFSPNITVPDFMKLLASTKNSRTTLAAGLPFSAAERRIRRLSGVARCTPTSSSEALMPLMAASP